MFVQVDSVEKIEKLLKGKSAEFEGDEFTGWPSADYNCLLIEVSAVFSLLTCVHEYALILECKATQKCSYK